MLLLPRSCKTSVLLAFALSVSKRSHIHGEPRVHAPLYQPMDLLKACLPCAWPRSKPRNSEGSLLLDEKHIYAPQDLTTQRARDFVEVLRTARKAGPALHKQLNDVIGT